MEFGGDALYTIVIVQISGACCTKIHVQDLEEIFILSLIIVMFAMPLFRAVKCSSVLVLLYGRERAASTNVGKLLERSGKEFLGSRYKDPISSFLEFQEFSDSKPEVLSQFLKRFCHSHMNFTGH